MVAKRISLISALLLGCGTTASESTPNVAIEELGSEVWSPIVAMARDGASIYVARTLGIERIDTTSGKVTRIAGPEYATCPHAPSMRWAPLHDFYYRADEGTAFYARDGAVYMADPNCGVWTFRIADGVATTLIALRGNSPEQRFATWGGAEGPRWTLARSAVTFTKKSDGDLVVCVLIETGTDKRGLQLWLTSPEGSPKRRLATIDSKSCWDVTTDDEFAYFVATQTDVAVWRTPLKQTDASAERIIRLRDLDSLRVAYDPEAIYFMGQDGGYPRRHITRMRKAALGTEELFAETPSPPAIPYGPRGIVQLLGVQAGGLYWLSDDVLHRTDTRSRETRLLLDGVTAQAGFIADDRFAYVVRERNVDPYFIDDARAPGGRIHVGREYRLVRFALP